MATNEMLNVGIMGASGYAGAELLSFLLFHPKVKICFISAHEQAGKPLVAVHPQFRRLCELEFQHHKEIANDQVQQNLDLIFMALPHGYSQKYVSLIDKNIKIIDLGADYRIKDEAIFQEYYHMPHQDPQALSNFVYGLSEINRKIIEPSTRIANPGCFATAVQLAMIPLLREGMIDQQIIIDAKTGSSGSGITTKKTTHHPFRASSFYAYKMLSHQHEAEILQTFSHYGYGDPDQFVMQVHSLPLVRGIFASCYCRVKSGITKKHIRQAFINSYQESYFIRLIDESPNVSTVQHSNFADLSFHLKDRNLVVFSAIDNLVKGAAGQAIQNMNLMSKWEEHLGLNRAGGGP